MHQFLKFIFGIELYMFRTVPLSIVRSLVQYTQQQAYVIQVMLSACYPVWHIPITVYTVLDSWLWAENLSETCWVLFQK